VNCVTQLDLQSITILAGRKSVSGFSKNREIAPDLSPKSAAFPVRRLARPLQSSPAKINALG
jgi:hypothetical protein